MLLQKGADPSLVNSKDKTPLDVCHNEEIHKLLLEYQGTHPLNNEPAANDETVEEDKDVFAEDTKEIKSPHPLFIVQTPPTRVTQIKHGRRAGTPPARLQGHTSHYRKKGNSRGSFYSEVSSSESETDHLESAIIRPRLFDLPSITEADDSIDQSNESAGRDGKSEFGKDLEMEEEIVKEEEKVEVGLKEQISSNVDEDGKVTPVDDVPTKDHLELCDSDSLINNSLLISFPLEGLTLSSTSANEGADHASNESDGKIDLLAKSPPPATGSEDITGPRADPCSVLVVTGSIQRVTSIGEESAVSDRTSGQASPICVDDVIDNINEDSTSTVVSFSTSLPLVFGSSRPQSPTSLPSHNAPSQVTTLTLSTLISETSQESLEGDTGAAAVEKVKSPTFEIAKGERGCIRLFFDITFCLCLIRNSAQQNRISTGKQRSTLLN